MICFALLAHDKEDILSNQIMNLRKFNPDCKIVLFNSGTDANIGRKLDIPVCPASRPMKEGATSRFLLEIMIWLKDIHEEYDYLINPDPELMFIRHGFEEYLHQVMTGYDSMGINLNALRSANDLPNWYPGQLMWKEWEQWQPFFETDFFYRCLSFMQVYRREIAERMASVVNQSLLDHLIAKTDTWALEEILYPTLAIRCGGKFRSYPAEQTNYVRMERPLLPDEVQDAQCQPNLYFVYPILRKRNDPARQWVSQRTDVFPSSLTIIWGCYQGGVETALYYRLQALNALGAKAHAYFYHAGVGLANYDSIPYHISQKKKDLGAYIELHQFNIVTFVNTLYNLEQLNQIKFKGKAIYEFHGYDEAIATELTRINNGEDEGKIQSIVVPSDYVRELAGTFLKNRPDLQIYVSRNTLDTNQFQQKQNTIDFIIDNKLPKSWKNHPLIGWVGRLDNNKNWKMLLSIFHALKIKHSDAKLLIVSDLLSSAQLNEFYNMAAKYKLIHEIRVLPNVPHIKMPLYYSLLAQSGGVLLSTSFSEGYPYNLLEAQACECPVVCSNIKGSMEIVKHGLTGLSFPLNDLEMAVSAVQSLMQNWLLRKNMTESARKFVCGQHHIKRNVLDHAQWMLAF